MAEWKPIETAPKDETKLILWWPYWSQKVVIGQFYLGEWWAEEKLTSEGDGPTHWMPLPDPPKVESQEQG